MTRIASRTIIKGDSLLMSRQIGLLAMYAATFYLI